MTPEQHDEFLDALDNALECAIRRHRALHHASLAELMEMQKEVSLARTALEKVLTDKVIAADEGAFQETVRDLNASQTVS